MKVSRMFNAPHSTSDSARIGGGHIKKKLSPAYSHSKGRTLSKAEIDAINNRRLLEQEFTL